MKKCTFWLLMALSLSAFGWCNHIHHYKVSFVDGGGSVIMTTRSLSSNYLEEVWTEKNRGKGIGIYFYFSIDELYDVNMKAIKEAEVEDKVKSTRMNTKCHDGCIMLDNVDEIKEID